jgi:hypothetical protein
MHLVAYGEPGEVLGDYFFPGHLGYAFKSYFDLHCIKDNRIYKKSQFMPNIILAKDRMARDEHWKLIIYPMAGRSLEFRSELFDLTTDPWNLNDVSSSHPEVVERLRTYVWPYINSDLKEYGSKLPKELFTTTESVRSDTPLSAAGRR